MNSIIEIFQTNGVGILITIFSLILLMIMIHGILSRYRKIKKIHHRTQRLMFNVYPSNTSRAYNLKID